MCGVYCPSVNDYDTSVGSCDAAYIYDPAASGDATCSRDSPRWLQFDAVGLTPDGSTQLNLRVINQTDYVPWNANQNGVNGEWGNINVLGNGGGTFEFCFLGEFRIDGQVIDKWTVMRLEMNW